MNNNNNGKGIFYGVIGVATLVVAIIGATFAYFAASASSANNAVSAASSTVSALQLNEVKDGIKANLIPIDETNTKFPSKVGLTEKSCKDDNKNNICSTYQFTVTNPNEQAQQVYFYLEPTNNTFTNLHYAIFKGTPTTYNVKGEQVDDHGKASEGAVVVKDTQLTLNSTTRIHLDNLSQVLPAKGGATYTIVLWIHETNGDQTTIDAGKTFTGGVRISTGVLGPDGTATSGVTGILAA